MRRIKEYLATRHPLTTQILLPTTYMEIADVEPDRAITEAFGSIVKERPMGSQYDWIARFCKQSGIAEIELCIHRDDKAHKVLSPFVRETHLEISNGYRVNETDDAAREYLVFRYFTFPLFDLTKVEMAAIAEEQGWTQLMNMTWFCHHPRFGRTPCGVCKPCLYAMEEGLGWRIPPSSRALGLVGRSRLVKGLRRLAEGSGSRGHSNAGSVERA
jgi:hypothetical protein